MDHGRREGQIPKDSKFRTGLSRLPITLAHELVVGAAPEPLQERVENARSFDLHRSSKRGECRCRLDELLPIRLRERLNTKMR